MLNNENLSFSHNADTEGTIRIASVAVATPPYITNQAQAEAFLIKHYTKRLGSRNLETLHKIFAHPSVLRRHIAVEDLECLVNEHPDSRIARFTYWAVDLSSQAIVKALTQVGLTVDAVSGLVVNTCTGYICPGISTYLIEKLGLSNQIRAHDLVGSGCGGAVPNLQMCEDMLKRSDNNNVILSVSVEICSATFQMADDLSLIISNAIFADGAAASVLWHRPEGLALIASASHYDPKYRNDIRYIYKNGQLHNQLSIFLPELASKTVARVVMELLKPRGLQIKDIKHWALHPGGEKVINAIKNEVGLSETQLHITRDVLAKYGNMSSPTVLFVLHEILDKGIKPGDWCIMIAFGAGLCAHALLLRA
ncbi:MAG TPA: type III polyketide synthase [Candidatus Brocadiia bacterium]